MRYTVAVDIGKWTTGVVIFDGNQVFAGFECSVSKMGRAAMESDAAAAAVMARLVHRVVYPTVAGYSTAWVAEKMVDYDGKGARERDLEHLRKVLTHLEKLVTNTDPMTPKTFDLVRAHEWKGNVPKRVTEYRVRGLLSQEEFDSISPWTKETWDAAGIGLFWVGRAGRGSTPR